MGGLVRDDPREAIDGGPSLRVFGSRVEGGAVRCEFLEAQFFVLTTPELNLKELAFAHAGLDWREHVELDPRYLRPSEVDALCGDASKARRELGWAPRVGLRELVRRMVDADLALAAAERRARG